MQTSRKEGAQSNLPKTSQFLPGIYAAYAESAFSGYPDEAWTVSITQDAYDGDKVWIQPILAPFGGLDADDISPVYAYVDEENSTLRLPLGQTLYGGPREYYNIVVASLDNNSQPVISGEIVVPYYISDDNLTFTIDFLGAGDLNDEAGWWYQALLGIKFSSWTDNAIDGFYYTITSEDECTVAVTYAGEDYRSFKNEYSGSIVIPEKVIINEKSYSVTSIGEFAFADCTGLTEITIPNSVTSIGDYAFSACTGLTEVTIPNSVTSIGDYAFRDCTGLTSVTIPNSVTSIGVAAFAYCTGLTEVTIPNSVTSIGDHVFSYCIGLTSIVVDKDNQAYDSRDNCNAIIETATNTLITGCKNSFIPNRVTSIGDRSFYGCTGLTEVTIPNSVTSIGDYAFYGCTGLTSVTIPNSVTSIGYEAFYSCYGLTEVTIGNSVTSIGGGAFEDCTGLGSVTIGNSVTSIGWYAFSGCTGLTEITIPNSVTSIGGGAFEDCTGLGSVTIGNSVTSIGDYVFRGCSGLTSIVVDKDNQAYDSRDNCNAIIETATNTLITGCKNSFIPNSITSIGDFAFYGCTGLKEITIPNSVTSIRMDAFRHCFGLTEIHSKAFMPPSTYYGAFNGIDRSIPVYVPAGCVELYIYELEWNEFTNIIEEPGSSVAPKYLDRGYIAEATNALEGADVNYYVSITIDDDVPNRIWIHPVLQPFGGLNSSDILPVYAYVDALSNSIVMPLGQTLFGGNGESFNILLGTFNENDGNINTHGVTIATYSIEDEVLNIAWNDLLVAYDNGLYQALMNIIFTTEVTGVENVSCDNSDAPTEYYDLSGRCIENPTRGIYIVKQGNTVKKVVL